MRDFFFPISVYTWCSHHTKENHWFPEMAQDMNHKRGDSWKSNIGQIKTLLAAHILKLERCRED